MPMFMNYTNVPGDVTTKGHEKWIEINSFQWGVGRGITSAAAGGSDREASTPSVSEAVVTKITDGATNNLIRAACGLAPAGEGQTVIVDLVKTDQGEPETYMQITLTNALVSGFSISTGGDRPSESLTLNFTAVEIKNIGMGAANATGSPDTYHYDLTTQTGS
jgi:type VI secretion system secreted protein Hcp